MSKAGPIIFSGEMINAILEGRKTQTRIIMKPQPKGNFLYLSDINPEYACFDGSPAIRSPYGYIGDTLWVRETFVLESIYTDNPDDHLEVNCLRPHYRATEPEPHIVPCDLEDEYDDRTRRIPPLYMPKWASRITLKIKDIRVERLQDISEDDAIKEGVYQPEGFSIWISKDGGPCQATPKWAFMELWQELYDKDPAKSWSANPFVWVIEFERVK